MDEQREMETYRHNDMVYQWHTQGFLEDLAVRGSKDFRLNQYMKFKTRKYTHFVSKKIFDPSLGSNFLGTGQYLWAHRTGISATGPPVIFLLFRVSKIGSKIGFLLLSL